MKKAILILIITHFSICSFGQRGPSIAADYEMPLGGLGEIYNPTISYTLNHISYKDNSNPVWNISLGYYKFKPKEDFFVEQNATSHYSDYTVIPLYIGISHDIKASDAVSILPGFDMGYFYTWYNYEIKIKELDWVHGGYITSSIGGDEIQGRGVLSPKLNVLIKISPTIHLQLRTKYNLFFALGSSDSGSVNYNSSVGQVNHSMSHGGAIVFFFNKG